RSAVVDDLCKSLDSSSTCDLPRALHDTSRSRPFLFWSDSSIHTSLHIYNTCLQCILTKYRKIPIVTGCQSSDLGSRTEKNNRHASKIGSDSGAHDQARPRHTDNLAQARHSKGNGKVPIQGS